MRPVRSDEAGASMRALTSRSLPDVSAIQPVGVPPRTARDPRRSIHHAQRALETFLAYSPDGVVVVDRSGLVLYANAAAEALLARDAEHLVGRPFGLPLVVGENAEIDIIRPDGGRSVAELRAVPTHWHGRRALVACLRDVTLRSKLDDLREEAVEWAALVRVGRELVSVLDTNAVPEAICRLANELLDCDRSMVLMFDPTRDGHCPVASLPELPRALEALWQVGLSTEQLRGLLAGMEGERVRVVDAGCEGHPARRALARNLTAAHLLLMPFEEDGETLGVLVAVRARADRPFRSNDRHLADGLSCFASLVLQKARVMSRLEEASRHKSEFVATISHELRTPLNVILGYGDLLCDGAFGELSAEQKFILQRSTRSARELHDLINNTLIFSRLETGRYPVRIEPVDLHEIVMAVVREIPEQIQPRPEVRLVADVAPHLPPLQTDPWKLRVLLKNLLTNALKFTERGEVRVAADHVDGQCELRVSDTGIGIATNDLEIIFEPFRQVDGSSTRRHGGAGIGLHVARRMVELLDGTLTVESRVGEGSTFRVRLPVTSARQRPALRGAAR
ncbi:PAS domain-containing protein [Candidatus Binatia bacterium]|nr:PAS domain-containing protein [Candidatus Binatia bacterium]